jgi:hypothetical protein
MSVYSDGILRAPSLDAKQTLPLDVLLGTTVQLAGDFVAGFSVTDPNAKSGGTYGAGAPISGFMNSGGRAPKRSRGPATVPQWIQHWQSCTRGDAPFVCTDTAEPGLLESTTLAALTSVFATPTSGPEVETPLVVPISTVTHENLQLVFDRPGIPLCGNGHDCATRALPGGAMLGPLGRYLYPEEQILYDTHGAECLKERFASTRGAPCLLCLRTLAQVTNMAIKSTGCLQRRGGNPGVVLPPFTNLVDVVDGYRRSAMAITPEDTAVAGGVWLCGSTSGLSIKINKLSNKWFVAQDASIVFTEDPVPPCL